MTSPNQLPLTDPTEAIARQEQLFQQIEHQPGVESLAVTHNATSFDIERPVTEANTTNKDEGLDQDLHAVIRAGGELFGVVKARAIDFHDPEQKVTEKFILTRFGKDGQRATIVGRLDPTFPIHVGRSHQDGLAPDTSRDHFRVGINNENKLVIEDLGSSNGTELLVGRDVTKEVAQPQPEGRFGFKALKRAVKKSEENTNDTQVSDPLMDFNKWAPKSYDMKIEALSTQSGIYLDRPHSLAPIKEQAPEPVIDLMKKYEQEPVESIKNMAEDVDRIQEVMAETIKGLTALDGQKLELGTHTFHNLFASSDFISRSIHMSLRDARNTGVITDPEVAKALRYAFEIPLLDTNTSPSHLDWKDEDAVIKHAELIQSKLHGIGSDRRAKDIEHFPWAIPDAVSRLSHGFATIAHAIARNSQAAPRFDMAYHNGNLATPRHEAAQIMKALDK